ncbi:MAG: hypothetical protein A3F78_03810 [Burkholderiales bacterium RIFCSPLOWO2_12_FULL_61_40]|nr:MAG: hypothetical protein A3F78_03810 [Burkholderiales bacterium RIFCSPLOWO2_12_FULL_61_40]
MAISVKDFIDFPLGADTPGGTEVRMRCLVWRLAKPCKADTVLIHRGERHPKTDIGLVSETVGGGMKP